MLHIILLMLINGVLSTTEGDLNQDRFDEFIKDLRQVINETKEIDNNHKTLAKYFKDMSGINSIDLQNSCNAYANKRRHFINEIKKINYFIEQHNLTGYRPQLKDHSFLQVEQYELEIRLTLIKCNVSVRIIKLNEKLKVLVDMNQNANIIADNDLIDTSSIKEKAIPIKNTIVAEIENCLREVESIKQYCYENDVVCNDTKLLNNSYYETVLHRTNENLQELENYLMAIAIYKYVQPTVYFFVFMIGFIGNSLLLLIFYKNQKFRKPQNMIIFNLALSDTLSLIINLPLFHAFGATEGFGIRATAQIIMFSRYLCFSLSVFTTVALALQRYSATLKASNYIGHILRQSETSSAKMVNATVWIVACILAIPFAVHTDIYFVDTYSEKRHIYIASIQAINMFQLIALGILPFIAISILSWLTVRRFNDRTKKIPADIPELHREYQIRVLSRSIAIIKICPIVFACTWLPFLLFYALRNFFYLNINSTSDAAMKVIATSLLFLGCSVNPIGLYIASGNFRRYMRSMFGLRPSKSSLKYHHQERQSKCISIEQSTHDTKL